MVKIKDVDIKVGVNDHYGVNRDDLHQLVQAYVTRTECEDLDYIETLGGLDALCKKLGTDRQQGLRANDVDFENRKETFGENRLPERKPTRELVVSYSLHSI